MVAVTRCLSYPAPAALIEHCLRHKTAKRPAGTFQTGALDPSHILQQIKWIKDHIPPDDPNHPFTTYDAWIETGFAFKLEFGAAGFQLWEQTFDDRVNHDIAIYKWEHSFDSEPHAAHVTIGTWIDRVNTKLECPIHAKPLASVMFARLVAKIAADAGATLSTVGSPIVGRADEQARCGLPILQEFMDATADFATRPGNPDYPTLPSDCSAHPLYTPLNDMIGRVMAMAENSKTFKPNRVVPALSVLGVVHPDVFDTVVRRLQIVGCKVSRPQLKHATLALQDRVERAFVPQEDWILDTKGYPESDNSDNVEIFFKVLGLEIRWNAWLERAEVRGGNDPNLTWTDWTYFDDTVAAKLRTRANRTKTRFRPAKEFFWESVISLAHMNRFDPATSLLSRLQAGWDGVPRLSGWVSRCCHIPNDSYHKAVSLNIIGGMVRRIRNPGCKHDTMPVFYGPQGTGKSTMAAILALDPTWFSDSIMFGVESKELVLSLAGKAVCEISEMGMRGSTNANHVKAMISRQVDAGRTAYARSVTERPRRNIFVGTTNSDTPLDDPSGNRRFLPVAVERHIDLEWLSANIAQLVGEAATLESASATFELPRDVWADAAERQEAVRAESDVEVLFKTWFAETEGTKSAFVLASDLIALTTGVRGASNNSIRGDAMRSLGFRQDRVGQVRRWVRGNADKAAQFVVRLDINKNPTVCVIPC